MKKKKRRRETNAHHVLFQRRHWESQKAIYLRNMFVYQVSIDLHNELHNEIIHDVPIPRDIDLLFLKAKDSQFSIKFFTLKEGLTWLYKNSSDQYFRESINRQHEFFFKTHI